jgi:ribosome biogenesis GTPase / thiamine phosphate phosphatase
MMTTGQYHMANLEALGWNGWFDEQAGLHCHPTNTVARVVAVDRGLFLIINDKVTLRAKLSGKFMFAAEASSELPCVGDWVCIEKSSADAEFALIHGIVGRKTELRRKQAGKTVEYQMIAANVDFVVIVQSCHYDFNLKRLQRYLIMVTDGGARPYILLSKTDLVAPETLNSHLAEIKNAGITAPILTLSNITHEGVDELKNILSSGKTYCFVGSSGVGKSTIINGLVGRQMLETKGVSETGEGRHTTVRRELITLENGAMVIDNPGMREFGIVSSDDGVEAGFSDIGVFASQCHFRNCTHTNEPNCGVLKALENGEIAPENYDNFLKLREESQFNRMSYAEKRKKDKDFGRFLKTAKKHL